MKSARRISLWAPVAAYMALIFYLSSLSDAPLSQGMSDKSGHGIGYFGFGLVVTRAVAGGLPAPVTWRIAVAALAIGIGYGCTDEFHQLFVPGRSADLADLAVDAVSVAASVAALWAWGIIRDVPPRRT